MLEKKKEGINQGAMTTRDHRHGHHHSDDADGSFACAHDNNSDLLDQGGHPHDSAITVEWLLNAASARLAANKGARCPLRVALAALGADIEERLVSTTDLRGSALWAARQAAIQLARSTPEVLCTLTMCDLCVSWSRALLASVKPRAAAAAAANGKRFDFHALTTSFAEASVAQKKTDDPSALYSVCVYGVGDRDRDDDADGDANDSAGSGSVDYCFANEATYVSYRYFLRRAWEGLVGVPPAWVRPMPRDVCGWIESAMRMRDLCLTLQQHRLCLPPRHNGQHRDGGGETHAIYRREGGRGGRLPSDDDAERVRHARRQAATQSASEHYGRRLNEIDSTAPTSGQEQEQQYRQCADPDAARAPRRDAMCHEQAPGVSS